MRYIMDNATLDRAVEDFLDVATDEQIAECREENCHNCSDGWNYNGSVAEDNPYRELCDCVIFGDIVEQLVCNG